MIIRSYVCLSLMGLAFFTIGCGKSVDQAAATQGDSTPKIPVELAQATSSDVAATIELVGSLIPRRRTIIVSEVDGVIAEIPEHERIEAEIDGQRISETARFDIGVEVEEGDVLVRLDPRQYQLKLQAAQARLNTAERQLDELKAWQRTEEIRSAEAAREEAAARLVPTESHLKRMTSLLEERATSQAQYDQAEADLKAARATLARVEAELALAKAGPTEEEIAVAEAAVAQAKVDVDRAQWELDRTEIDAPYDGVVTDRFVDEGDRVTAMPRVEIMELMNIGLLSAQLGVPERYINQIQVGNPAKVYVKGSVESVSGMVVLINDKVDPSNRTFRIRVAIRNEERRFKAGQFVRVALEVESSPSALTVPAQAITYTGGEAHVFVYNDGRVQQRAVTLGVSNAEVAEVLAGLSVGEQVVVDDPSVLCDGMLVQVRAADTVDSRTAKVRQAVTVDLALFRPYRALIGHAIRTQGGAPQLSLLRSALG